MENKNTPSPKIRKITRKTTRYTRSNKENTAMHLPRFNPIPQHKGTMPLLAE